MKDLRRLLHFVRPYLATLAGSLLLLVFAGLFEVLTTALAIPLFDKILIPGASTPYNVPRKLLFLQDYLSLLPGSILTQLAVALVLLTSLKGLCLYYSNYFMSRVGQHAVTDLRNELYRHVMDQSMGFFALNSTGRLMSSMTSDVEQVQEAVSTSIAELFREAVLLGALIIWIFYIDWKLATLALTIAPAALLMTLTMGKRIRRASLRSRESVAALSDHLQQSLSGVRIVKAFGMESHERRRFGTAAAHLLRSNMRAVRILFLNSPLMELLGVFAFIPLLYYAHSRIVSGTLTPGLFGGSLFSLFRMYDPIRKLSRIHVQFQRALASSSRIAELFDTHVEIQDRPDARTLEGVRESIEFRNVHFAYDGYEDEAHVLKNINLAISHRQVVALVGSSGSGKTTLVSMIPRFYEASIGSILIDGVDIREYSQNSLRRNIALVTQETFLFNDTVRNNIAYGNPNAVDEQVVAAARAALAHDFIMQLPMQYETVIGERGQRLSGGERQRLSIARAILKNAPILVLDEATSALDSASEKLVQEALANLMHDRTTFVIAHRLSTVRNADLIVVLEDGKIQEVGSHEALMAKHGLYSRFFRLQTEESFSPSLQLLRAN